MRLILALAAGFALSGCLAKTALDVVTLPVRVVSHGVDAVTTSRAERDRAEGRRIREEDRRVGRESREAQRRDREEASRCKREHRDDCPVEGNADTGPATEPRHH